MMSNHGFLAASDKKMRICINGRFLTQPITGVQRFAEEVVRALDHLISRGVIQPREPVTVLAPRAVLRVPRYTAIEVKLEGRLKGHAWEQLELPYLAGERFLVNLCQIAPALRARQLVVMHDASVHAVPWAFSWRFRTWYKALLPLIARRSSQLATVSQFSREELAAYLGCPASRFAVVRESGDHILSVSPDRSVLSNHGIRPGRYVLAVSSRNPNKNFAGLVRALGLLRDPNFDVVIAGGSDPRIFGLLPSLPSYVRAIGYVSDGQLRALYESAACFVYPSFYEGFGLPPLEAMVCGCPVLVSGTASMPEICADAALYCNPDSSEDIAAKLKQLMSNQAIREDLRAKGKRRAADFSWERCARDIWELVEKSVQPARLFEPT